MPPVYSITAINGRLNGLVTTIDANGNGFLKLFSGPTTISTIQLSNPVGTVSGGVLTFTGTLLDPSAAATGFVTTATITDGLGSLMISGLSVGAPLSGADVIISNGTNTTLISSGQTVQVLAAQITGS